MAAQRKQERKRLRLGSDKVIAGVCSGFADYFDADPVAVRILWAVLSVFTAVIPGIIIYIICWIIMPGRDTR